LFVTYNKEQFFQEMEKQTFDVFLFSQIKNKKNSEPKRRSYSLIFHSIEATEIKKTAILQNKTSKLETRAGKFVARKQANRSTDVSVDIPIENSVEESTPFDKTTDLIQTSFDETPPQKRKSKKK
jgi:hypothetical protein